VKEFGVDVCSTMSARSSTERCAAWDAVISRLQAARRRARNGRSLAVCLTGQLRLFMVGFPALARHVLVPAAHGHTVDFFYVGPMDLSYQHGSEWLHSLPGFTSAKLYSPRLRWMRAKSHEARMAFFRSGNATFSLHGMSCPIPGSRLKSRLVQALQASECLRLISSAERRRGARYNSVLRARPDMLATRQVRMPLGSMVETGMYSSLTECPRDTKSRLAYHDFALYGSRLVMETLLDVINGVQPAELMRHQCDFGALAATRLHIAFPNATCVAPHGNVPIATIRGNARDHCFFVDQEHPPNDDQAQPRLADMFDGAQRVASDCLHLVEQRDGRRPGTGRICKPRGGWDGDFREDDSPWNSQHPINRGSGRRA
jgi:hypothetical protein